MACFVVWCVTIPITTTNLFDHHQPPPQTDSILKLFGGLASTEVSHGGITPGRLVQLLPKQEAFFQDINFDDYQVLLLLFLLLELELLLLLGLELWLLLLLLLGLELLWLCFLWFLLWLCCWHHTTTNSTTSQLLKKVDKCTTPCKKAFSVILPQFSLPPFHHFYPYPIFLIFTLFLFSTLPHSHDAIPPTPTPIQVSSCNRMRKSWWVVC